MSSHRIVLVEDDPATPSIQIEKETPFFGVGLISGERPCLAHRVAAGSFDLQNVGALICELFDAEGAGKALGQVEHF